MSSLQINKGSLKDKIDLPRSKSYANRALILAAISPLKTLHHLPSSSDVTFLVKALSQVGLKFIQTSNTLVVLNTFPACEMVTQPIEVGEGGTTARFLACLLLKGSLSYELILGERLKERPWNEFITFVNAHEVKAELKGDRLYLQGPLKLPDTVEVDCSLTTQFASGLKLAFHQESEIRPVNMQSSESLLGDDRVSLPAFPHDGGVQYSVRLE